MTSSRPRSNRRDRWRRPALAVAAVVATLLLAEVGLRAGGCGYRWRQAQRNQAALENGEYRILCLGESTTAMGGDYAYPAQLDRVLDGMELGVEFAVVNRGTPGTNSSGIAWAFADELARYDPHMVVAMMGINDPRDEQGHCDPSALRSLVEDLRLYKLVARPWPWVRRFKKPAYELSGADLAVGGEADVVSNGDQQREYRRRVRRDPGDREAHILLARALSRDGRIEEARTLLDEAVEREGAHADLLAARGELAWAEGDARATEYWFGWALQVEPGHAAASLGMGRAEIRSGRVDRGLALLERGWDANPGNSFLATEVAEQRMAAGDDERAVQVLERTAAVDGSDPFLHLTAGRALCRLGRYDEAEAAMQRALAIQPEVSSPHEYMASCYERAGLPARAADHMAAMVAAAPQDSGLRRRLGELQERAGDAAAAAESRRLASEIEASLCPSVTREAYQALYDLSQARAVRLVAVQYPRRNVEQLRRMFTPDQDVIFVDNERSFHEAVREYGYGDLFNDRFAGDFGHATPRGNRLLAENVAQAIADAEFRSPEAPDAR